MNIRKATPKDSLLLSSLCMDVQCLHAENYPDIFKLPMDQGFAASFFDEMLADPKAEIYIAEEHGQAIGYVLCRLIERPENPFTYAMRYLLVDQISVRPNRQVQGVGTALINRVETLAKELNVTRIQLDSWGFNTQTHAFFEKLGFEKFNYRFWRDV